LLLFRLETIGMYKRVDQHNQSNMDLSVESAPLEKAKMYPKIS
jgi:hypothetical protein